MTPSSLIRTDWFSFFSCEHDKVISIKNIFLRCYRVCFCLRIYGANISPPGSLVDCKMCICLRIIEHFKIISFCRRLIEEFNLTTSWQITSIHDKATCSKIPQQTNISNVLMHSFYVTVNFLNINSLPHSHRKIACNQTQSKYIKQ